MVKIGKTLLFVIEVLLLPIVLIVGYPIGLINWICYFNKKGYAIIDIFIGYNRRLKDGLVKFFEEWRKLKK